MREFFAELHHQAWTATAVCGALAAACALAGLASFAALAAMAAGLILMWISEEENTVLAAMGKAPAVEPAPALAPHPAPAVATEAAEAPPAAVAAAPEAPAATAPAARLPAPANDPEHETASVVREWMNPFPAPRPLRRQHAQGRRARR